MLRCLLWCSVFLAVLVLQPARVFGQSLETAVSADVAEVRDAVHRYDDALRRGDAAAVGQFFAPEYIFVNARGERLTRADRLANLRAGRTAFDSLAHAPQEEQIRPYGNVVVYTTLLTIGGRYSGKAEQGRFRALVVWVRRDGRWQQVVSQMTPVGAP
jgi:ketosteroid isomerase-like protein